MQMGMSRKKFIYSSFVPSNGTWCSIWCGVNKIFWKNNEAAVVNPDPYSNHREQARDSLDFCVISVACEMLTLKRFCAVVEVLIINFFQKNFFLP